MLKVCSREEQDLINEGTKQANHLLQKLMDQKVPGLEAAIEQRNRLLEYDRTRYNSHLNSILMVNFFKLSHENKTFVKTFFS